LEGRDSSGHTSIDGTEGAGLLGNADQREIPHEAVLAAGRAGVPGKIPVQVGLRAARDAGLLRGTGYSDTLG